MRRQVETYRIKEKIDLTPQLFINLVASTLYSKRFSPYFVSPVVVGLDSDGKSYVANYDSIGCLTQSTDFQVAGTGTDMLYGTCETFFKREMNSDQLFESISQSLVSGVNRDSLSGWGGLVYLM
jgi:20S proteasome subunit beta 3